MKIVPICGTPVKIVILRVRGFLIESHCLILEHLENLLP